MRLPFVFLLLAAAGTVAADQPGQRQWSGTLVDANCAPSVPGKMAAIRSPDMKSNGAQVEESGSAARAEADRRDGSTTGRARPAAEVPGKWTAAEWRSCQASGATKSFGIVTQDGRMLRFDARGNALASSGVGHKAHATKGGPAPKEVTVHGTLAGDELRVESVK